MKTTPQKTKIVLGNVAEIVYMSGSARFWDDTKIISVTMALMYEVPLIYMFIIFEHHIITLADMSNILDFFLERGDPTGGRRGAVQLNFIECGGWGGCTCVKMEPSVLLAFFPCFIAFLRQVWPV